MPAAKFSSDQEREQAKARRSLARDFERAASAMQIPEVWNTTAGVRSDWVDWDPGG